MRRLVPFLLLGLLSALVLGSALLGVTKSARVSYYSLPPNNPLAAQALHGFVLATLDAPDYTLHVKGLTIQYESPNRLRIVPSGEIDIGSTLYLPVSGIGGRHWIEQKDDQPSQADAFSAELRAVLQSTSVQRDGNTFRTERVVSTASLVPGTPGQILTTLTLVVHGAYVVRETFALHGVIPPLPSPAGCRQCAPDKDPVLAPPAMTYSDFGRTPPIAAPPKSEVTSFNAGIHQICSASQGHRCSFTRVEESHVGR
jgi:hypothetical protein